MKTNQSDSFIKLTGHSDHEKLLLSIIDNGIGIASKYHDKIFDMFFRLSGKKNGSGIGLYIVKEPSKYCGILLKFIPQKEKEPHLILH